MAAYRRFDLDCFFCWQRSKAVSHARKHLRSRTYQQMYSSPGLFNIRNLSWSVRYLQRQEMQSLQKTELQSGMQQLRRRSLQEAGFTAICMQSVHKEEVLSSEKVHVLCRSSGQESQRNPQGVSFWSHIDYSSIRSSENGAVSPSYLCR